MTKNTREFLLKWFRRMERYKILNILSDKAYLKMLFKLKFDETLDLKMPRTFNEKLQWLKLYDRKPIYTKMVDKFEVKEIECVGLEFDPHVAEAVLTDHDENKPEGVVLEVLQKGYMYKDSVVRHSMVKVAN